MTAPALPAVPVLTDSQRERLAQALDDAVEFRYPRACEDCEKASAGLCGDHEEDLLRAESYAALGRELGVEVPL